MTGCMFSSLTRLIDDDEDLVEEHQSVHKARLSQQQPSNVSLEDCLKLFTKEEKVCLKLFIKKEKVCLELFTGEEIVCFKLFTMMKRYV